MQKLPIRLPNNRRELWERLARELLQIAHRVHQLAVVVRVDAREASQKVLRRHVEDALRGRVRRAHGRGGQCVRLRKALLERGEDGDGVAWRARPQEP